MLTKDRKKELIGAYRRGTADTGSAEVQIALLRAVVAEHSSPVLRARAQLDAARLLIWRAAELKNKGVRHSAESAMAKLYASEMSHRVTHKAIQVYGGYGYSKEFDVERHYRDSRITELYEGTSEIQRIVIAANVLKG